MKEQINEQININICNSTKLKIYQRGFFLGEYYQLLLKLLKLLRGIAKWFIVVLFERTQVLLPAPTSGT